MSPRASEVAPPRAAKPVLVSAANRPFPELIKQLFVPKNELTNRSSKPSPFTSANVAPVEDRPSQATPAGPVTFLNFQFPKFRKNPLLPPRLQKYKSHKPSRSKSPAATPAPLTML